VGWLASIMLKTNAQMGILANVVVGILGSFRGIAVADALKIAHRGAPAHWFVATPARRTRLASRVRRHLS
jgi:uncharacterized membrane protein YeaQ/YmgE (transglycosylase-associated protein family)